MEKLLKIKDIEVDAEIYPRNNYNWVVAYDYSKSIKAGAIFPLIKVALFKGKYYLIDGRHRIEANKINKIEHIKADVISAKDKNQMYVMAVQANMVHGHQFAPQEKAIIIRRLMDMSMSIPQISKIVFIPEQDIQPFITKRLTNTITGKEIILKSPLKHLSGEIVTDSIEQEQENFYGRGQIGVINQTISLVEDIQFLSKNKVIVARLKYLGELILKRLSELELNKKEEKEKRKSKKKK